MFRRVGSLFAATLLVVCLLSPATPAKAAEPKNKGLFVTPVREYIHVSAGNRANGALTIANITDKTAEITLSAEQFTVEDFTYDYMFTPSKRDWIKLQTTKLELQPNKSQEIPYTITIPAGAAPGGYYFTIFATEVLDKEAGRKVRVGEALYVTVNGELRLTSHIQKESIPPVSFGGDIPFTLDVKSTGNTHFFMYVSGGLKGVATDLKGQEATHILLPGTVRTVKGVIPSPLLPGVYEATYGYRVDDGQTITHTKYVVYLPLWFLAILAGAFVLGLVWWRRRKRMTRRTTTDS
jgi:hypothetical protein